MANGRRRPIAPVRKLIAAVLGTVATFVMLFGLGMTSWSIVALGVALLVLAVALVVVRGGGRAWVTGVAHVHTASEPPTAYAFGRCELQIVIDAPGLPPRSKKIIEPRVPVSKWPVVGQTLPIRVAIDDQRHVRILWDEVPTHAEASEAAADLPPEFDEPELSDDVLIEQSAPPWAQRRPDDDFPLMGPDDPVTVDRGDDLGAGRRDEPVVVRHTPGGAIVLEGTLVEPAITAPLPRRPRPGPDPWADATPPEPATPSAASATGTTGVTGTTGADLDPASAAEPASGTTTGEPTAVRSAASAQTASAQTASAQTAEDWAAEDRGEDQAAEDRAPVADRAADADAPSVVPEQAPAPVPGPARTTTPTPTAPVDDIDIDLDIDGPRATSGNADDPDEALLAGLAGGAEPADEAGPIHGVGITVLVTDLDRSVAFYRDMLGFYEIDGGEGNAILASGGTRLVLRAIRDVAPINRRLVHLNLEVDDIDAVYEDLKAKGVRFIYAPRVVNRGSKLELWAAAFRDPDGHGIALTQGRELRQPA